MNAGAGGEPILYLGGATASGKGAVALALAEMLDAELVLCDSVKVYRGLDVGANKPTPEAASRFRLHLVDVCEPTETFSAGRYAGLATEALRRIRSRGRRAVVVGGTLLFARALFDGLCAAPPTDPALATELEALGGDELRRRLGRVDPAAVERIPPRDLQRQLRALAVYLQTGRRLSDWWADTPVPDHGAPVVRVALTRPRTELYRRIDKRAARIFAGGILEETAALLERGCPPDCPGLSTIGYRQAVGHLTGRLDLGEAVDSTAGETRRLAKRQLSWLRGDSRFIELPVCGDVVETARAVSRLLTP